MRTLFYLYLGFILTSCNLSRKNNITIFYFKNEFSTPVSIDCDKIFRTLDLLKIEVNDKELYDFLTHNMSEADENFSDIDARYKIIIDSDTLCIDNFGYYIHKEGIGKINNFEFFKKYIKEYKGGKTEVTQSLDSLIESGGSDEY